MSLVLRPVVDLRGWRPQCRSRRSGSPVRCPRDCKLPVRHVLTEHVDVHMDLPPLSQICSFVCSRSHGIVLSQSRLGSDVSAHGKPSTRELTVFCPVRRVSPAAKNIRPRHVLRQLVVIAILIQPLSKNRHINRQEQRFVSRLYWNQHIDFKLRSDALSARCSSCNVIPRSRSTHICIMYGFSTPCAMTSSSAWFEYDDSAIPTPNLPAARDVASSPSGCANCCDAVGLNPKGRDT